MQNITNTTLNCQQTPRFFSLYRYDFEITYILYQIPTQLSTALRPCYCYFIIEQEYIQWSFNLLTNLIYQVLSLFNAILVDGKSKWYDGEDRPYEFGFDLQGNQHRKESKG